LLEVRQSLLTVIFNPQSVRGADRSHLDSSGSVKESSPWHRIVGLLQNESKIIQLENIQRALVQVRDAVDHLQSRMSCLSSAYVRVEMLVQYLRSPVIRALELPPDTVLSTWVCLKQRDKLNVAWAFR